MGKTTTKVVGIAGSLMAAILYYAYITTPINHRGMYTNDVETYIGTAGEQTEINWEKAQGTNGVAMYHATAYMSGSNRTKLANLNTKYKRNGIATIAYPYSGTGEINTLKAYNAAVTDSGRFTALVAEIEPYITGDYAGFYNSIRTASQASVGKKIERIVYTGWITQAGFDSTVKYTDRIYLHAYLTSYAGASTYGYVKTRLTSLTNSVKTIYGPTSTYKYNVVIIFSVEPSFGFNWFKSNSFQTAYSNFISYYNLNATPEMKARLTMGGYQVFVSKYAKQARP